MGVSKKEKKVKPVIAVVEFCDFEEEEEHIKNVKEDREKVRKIKAKRKKEEKRELALAKINEIERKRYINKVVTRKEQELLHLVLEGVDKEEALKTVFDNTVDYSREKALKRVAKIFTKKEVKRRWEEMQILMEEEYTKRLQWNAQKSTEQLTSIIYLSSDIIRDNKQALKNRIKHLERVERNMIKEGVPMDKLEKVKKELFKLKSTNPISASSVDAIMRATIELNKLHKLYTNEPTILGNGNVRFVNEDKMQD